MGKYIVVTWPESQGLEAMPGHKGNVFPICSMEGLEAFGEGAFFVEEDWYAKQNGEPTDSEKESYCHEIYQEIKSSFDDGDKVELHSPFTLSNGKGTAIGWYLDEGNEDIKVYVTKKPKSEVLPLTDTDVSDLEYESYFGLPLKDRYEIALSYENGEYKYITYHA